MATSMPATAEVQDILKAYVHEEHKLEVPGSAPKLHKTGILHVREPAQRNYNIMCGAPPYYPSSSMWCADYNYPLEMLLAVDDLYFNASAGPAACQSVSCDRDSGAAVYFCNDNPHPISVLFSTMGEAATATIRKCYVEVQQGDFVNRGQAFSPDNWNVFLGQIDPCTMGQKKID
ncbi:hypothetical protein F5Y15DRAFT_417054 [Xylariaceae sp. FL0016]|nr:hypothetical protein F5Y15DRAFT_417054 [Xylariaceae sp. FL0016]